MYFLLNKAYGGFSFSNEVLEFIKERDNYETIDEIIPENYRDDDDIFQFYHQYGSERISGPHAKLRLIQIPDATSDYSFEEYDGYENIVFVVDGKLHWM